MTCELILDSYNLQASQKNLYVVPEPDVRWRGQMKKLHAMSFQAINHKVHNNNGILFFGEILWIPVKT